MKELLFYGVTGTLEEGIDTSDATAVAGDIMLGKTAYAQGEKVTGTFTIESELSAQEQKLEALETILEGKVGGGAVRANIYVQENEPTKKDGIWLKMSDATAEHYVSDDNIFIGGTWSSDISNIPYGFNGALASVGNFIYLFGSQSDGKAVCKYNISTGIYTQLTNSPYDFNSASATSVGTDIYLFNGTNAYKYDTVTETYIQKTNIPSNLGSGAAVAVGTNIYLYCGFRTAYKYNTLTDTYTGIGTGSMPPQWYRNRCVAIGTDIWGCRK